MEYVLDEISTHGNHAGSKARDDVNNILIKNGFTLNELKYSYGGGIKDLLLKFYYENKDIIKMISSFNNEDFFLIQHPIICYSTRLGKKIRKYKCKNKFRSAILIHDLDELRFDKFLGRFKKGKFSNFIRDEIYYLDSFDYIISHNIRMTDYLVSKGINKNKVINLELFDYLSGIVNNIDVFDKTKVNIAGNLQREKAGYIYDLDRISNEIYNYELFGINYTAPSSSFAHYNGSFKPDELLKYINRGFGLIWDGDSLDECTGLLGAYTKYNNPHKLSLYMACGIPVIAWEQAAIADFIRKYDVGFCVSSLKEIENIIEKMDVDDYIKYQKNVKEVQKRVLAGQYLKDALNTIRGDKL